MLKINIKYRGIFMGKPRVILALVLLGLILINSFIVQAAYIKNKEIDTEIDTEIDININIVEDLLNRRIEIMNRGMYQGEEFDKIQTELEEIEKGDLLKEDMLSIEEVRNFPTDLAYVNKVIIKDIIKSNWYSNTLNLKLLMEWEVIYYEEKEKEEIVYNIEIVKEMDSYFLKKLEVAE